ncbi:MAG: radical SAM protein, partial [Candidatus Marsarchaeota archaeon]|nr:radical SAM protein [Candidatus Marsarchaeota archaeon]
MDIENKSRIRIRDGIKNAEFELTHSCNLQCIHCYSKLHASSELPTEKIKQIINELNENKIKEVHLNGGEPLMRKDLPDIIEYSGKIGMRTVLETNAVLLARPELFKNIKNLVIRASVDGPEKIHNRIRAPRGSINAFRISMTNLAAAKNAGIPVQVTCSINNINHNSVYEMVAQINKYGIEHIRLRLTLPVGFAADNWGVLGGLTNEDLIRLKAEGGRIVRDFPDIDFDLNSINRQEPKQDVRFIINPSGMVKLYNFTDFFIGDLKIETVGAILSRISDNKIPENENRRIVNYLSMLGMM